MSQTTSSARVIPLPRKASKEVRRQQIISATIDVLASRGIAQTTLSEVASKAGISHGLVIFHFQSKDNLLAETLNFMSSEYQSNWQTALDTAPPQPAAKLDALIRADFEPHICDLKKLIAWCAYWGEAQSRPFYQAHNGANDEANIRILEDLCRALINEGGYPVDAIRAARALRLTGEGTWLDFLTMRNPYSREEALQTVYLTASLLFPNHFSTTGLIEI